MHMSIERWNGLAPFDRVRAAKEIEAESAGRFRWLDIQPYELGQFRFDVARFEHDSSLFVLIPGDEVTLGFDPCSEFRASSAQLESWRGTAEEYGIDQPLQDYLVEFLSRPRTAMIPAALVEVSAQEIGLEPAGLDEPDVREVLAKEGRRKGARSYEINQKLRVTWDENGRASAFRIQPATHAEVVERLDHEGFRLPSSDDWEYFCGAGGRTLFRWGDDCPCDRYPTDINRREAAWRREWVLSAGTLEPPPEPFVRDWDLHVRPNAFGLQIASNPYESEIVAEAKVFRGGDGGCTICGGAGFFAGWLPLATAYVDPNLHECYGDGVTGTRMRRVWRLE